MRKNIYKKQVVAGQHRYLRNHTISRPNRRRHFWGAIELPTGQAMARIMRLAKTGRTHRYGVTLPTIPDDDDMVTPF